VRGIASVFLLACSLAVAYAQGSPKEAPPPPIPEHQGKSPHPGFAWKGGHYVWTGHYYRWTQGHWVNPPRPGGVWLPGNWVKRNDHWEYEEGHWKY
jgi:WXXGXW repeat (2 copies)